MNNLSNFAETLNELMLTHELSPKQLAEKLSLNEKTIYVWKQNTQSPTLSNLISLSDYFRAPLDYLAGRSDKTEPFYSFPCPPFHLRLREVMKEKGVSTYALKKKSQYGFNFFKRWENGTEPLLPTLIDLANILDCTIDYLVGRER